MNKRIEDIIKQEMDAIRKIPRANIETAVAEIYDRIHFDAGENPKGKVVISGMGKAGHIGYNIAMTLSSTGTPAVFLHPSEAQHGDLGIIQEHDILIVLSNSGKTREIVELLHLTQNLHIGIPTISITGNPESEVAKLSNIPINIGKQKEICPLGLTPTASTTAMTVVGDILVILVMERIKFTKEEYAKRHHSGYLGKKARGEE